MAIGFNLPGIPGQIRGTAEEAGAVPDLGQAMMKGFRSNLDNIQGAPRLLSQQLLSNALANKIRGVEAQYAEPMAKTKYDQALANLRHQGLINQYYGRMQESALRGQGLSQEHQRMVNDIMKRQLDRQKRYDELLEQYRQQGATLEQAHQLATQDVDQTHPMPEQAPAPQQDLAQTILGAQMPDYLANIAPQGQQVPADVISQNVPYSAMLQPQFGQPQAQAFQLPPEPQAVPEYLQRPEEAAMAMQEAQATPTQAPAQQQPKSYVERLQQAGYNTSNANPMYAAEDQIYLQNPDYREMLKQRFPNIGTKQFNDFPRNRMITTETLPSGATRTRIMPLGGQEGGGALPYKALSPYGKAVEDLKHYMDIGDLQSAEGAKKYVDSILEKEGKTQTGFDKAYKEWQNAVQEYGPESKQAKDYRSRVEALMRGNQTIQLNKGFPITNPETGEQGYAYPQTKDEKLISGGRAAFNYIYPILEEGVKPFSGTITQTTTALANAVKNQNVSKEAAKQLENFLLADKIRQSGGIKELRLIGGGMFKKTLEAITNTLANDQIQKDIKNFTKNNLINRDIQIRVNKRFRDVLNGMSDAELKASREYVPIFPSQVSLKDNIKQGLKKPIANKNNQLKSRTTEPDVIVVTPEMVKGL